MRYSTCLRRERKIAAADGATILQRWAYGRDLLGDPKMMAASGKSLHGALEQLLAAAKAKGHELSEREIQRRLRCARAYETEAQIGQAMMLFGGWFALIGAGFPPVDIPGGDVPCESEPAQEPLDFGRWEQVEMFPGFTSSAALGDLETYCASMERMTSNYLARDQKRRAHLEELLAAADGDRGCSYDQARRALRERALARS